MRIIAVFWLVAAVLAKDVPFNFWGDLKTSVLACSACVRELEPLWPQQKEPRDICSNKLAYMTMAGCLMEGYPTLQLVQYFLASCQSRGAKRNITDFYEAYAYYNLSAETITPDTTTVSEPIRLNASHIDMYMDAFSILYNNKDRSIYYGLVILGYWALVFLVAAAANFVTMMFPKLRLCFNGTVSLAIRRFFTMPPLFRKSRLYAKKSLGFIHFYAPSRLETLVLAGFLGLTTILCVIDYKCVEKDPLHITETVAYAHYAANRTGIISCVLVPFVVLLSDRNSILQWMTRWNHATFLLYHRWVARVTILLVVLHSALAVVKVSLSHLFFQLIGQWYLVWGVIGTVVGVMLCFHSILYLRRRWYEYFYILHVIFGVIFLVASWVHLLDLGYLFLILISVVIWSLERLIRAIRVVTFGFPNATVTICAEETLRVEIPKPKHWNPIPGGHGWLTFGNRFWQSHPFTLYTSVTEKDSIVFLCGVKLGVTGFLAKQIQSSGGDSIRIRVTVEGPYGESTPCKTHSSAVFIAGGNGFPGIFSEVYDLAMRSPDSTQRLKFYWIIRELKSLDWVFEELEALAATKVEASIYVTRPDQQKEKIDEFDMDTFLEDYSEEKSLSFEVCTFKEVAQAFPHIKFYKGRANISELVDREVEECTTSVAFISCGHPAMVDDLRVSVVNKLAHTDKRIDCFDQLQSWA